jgi:thiol-disulfide isomerase/thioredoxin
MENCSMPDPLTPARLAARCVAAVLLTAVLGAANGAPTAVNAAPAIAWQPGASDAEVNRAFAAARSAGKPVFLYWGAVWCPPCNQVKATLFSRPDFIDRSRAFVPVYVDGDKPGAQKVAARFRVEGYPTMVLFKPDGTEITRLPGEVDPERYLLALSAALEAQVPVKELVRRVLAGQPLEPQQWRLLAFYSWDTDQEQVLAAKELGARLSELASRAPADLPEVRDRLALRSLAAQADGGPPDAATAAAGRQLLDRLLLDPAAAASQADLLTSYAQDVVKWLAPAGDQRRGLATRWDSALVTVVERSPSMSKAARVDALDARVSLWKLMGGSETLSTQQRSQVLGDVARIVAATSDRYERQAVVPSAAHVLREAGLVDESDELLKMELPHAVAPYYHMLGLAGNAKKRGDRAAALRWYEQAWRQSEGPATRLQWGAGYVGNLVELAPDDVGRIEKTAHTLVSELQPKSETFYERNQRALTRMSARLLEWQGKDPARRRAVANIRQQLTATCARLPPKDAGRANCSRVFPAA